MEITYNTNDISNPDEGGFTYNILSNDNPPPTLPRDRTPETPTNPQSGFQWPHFIHPYLGPVTTVVGEANTLFEAVHKEQEEGNNPTAPFNNDKEWNLAKWLIKNVSQTGIEEFTKLDIVSDYSIVLMVST